jgi:hypothetical protein
MPSPAAPPKSSPFLERMILFLMPLFLSMTPDFEEARAEILETLESYGARTRKEVLNAVQIIAFGLSVLDVLAEAKAIQELSPSMRLRFRGCASALNRACQQNEKTLAKSLKCDPPAKSTPDPTNDLPDAEVEKSIAHAQAQIDTYRHRLATTAPNQRHPNQRPRSSALFDALANRPIPDRPASPA